MTLIRSALVVLCLAQLAGTSFAEQVVIPVGQQGTSQQLPKKGASQAAVRSAYGEPSHIKGPVGQPPITTWEYPSFSVYFEYDHVIHAVANHQAANTLETPEQ